MSYGISGKLKDWKFTSATILSNSTKLVYFLVTTQEYSLNFSCIIIVIQEKFRPYYSIKSIFQGAFLVGA